MTDAPHTPAPTSRLNRVREQLKLYEHPLFDFAAQPKGDGVEVRIQTKATNGETKQAADAAAHTYVFDLHPRDLDHPQFEWQFQRQLYDALHDYLIEMFVRTPQDRALRTDSHERGL
jgi:hypothetical protein